MRDVVLRRRQLLARRNPNLQFDQVEAGDHLGDRVFDLQAGVHLHEEELVRAVGGDDELDGARAGVVHAAGGVTRGRADAGPGRGVQQRRRRLLDDLLVAPLQTALALAEVHHVAVSVGEHLHLDMPGVQHEPLEEQRVVAERGRGLAARAGQRGGQLRRVVHQPHALAAAARRRLDQHRISDIVGAGDEFGIGQARPGDPGDDRDAERRHRLPWRRSCRPWSGSLRPAVR